MRRKSKDFISSIRRTSIFTLDILFDQFIGNFGRFQKLLLAYLLLIVAPLVGFNVTTQFLILLEPPHTCAGEPVDRNRTLVNFMTNNQTHQVYDANMTEYQQYLQDAILSTPEREFNYDLIYPTVVSENDWVCENSWKARLPHVVYRAGSFCGMLVIGTISDSYGRIPTTVICFFIAGIAGLSTIFTASNYILFLMSRSLMGFVAFKGTVPVVLATEYVGTSERSLVSNGFLLSVGLTSAAMPWVAYFIRDWRLLTAITSAAMFVVPLTTLLIPESARWLLANGHQKRSKSVLQKVCRINGVHLTEATFNSIPIGKKESISIGIILKYTRFLKLYSITTLMWVLLCMISYGGNLYASVIARHPFLIMSTNAGVDVLASILTKYIADSHGRKSTVIVSSGLTSVFFTLTYFLDDQSLIFLCFLFLARFCFTIVYNVKFLYATEIIPTLIRSRAVSFRLAIGCIGSVLSAGIISITHLGRQTPLLIFGLVSLLTGLLMFTLPETLGKPLPENLEEANQFGVQEEVDTTDKRKKEVTSLPKEKFAYTTERERY